MANSKAFWCASCRRTFANLEQAAECTCGLAVGARRGEYLLTIHQVERMERRACSCGAVLIFIPSPSGSGIPIALNKVHAARCPCVEAPLQELLPNAKHPVCAVCSGRGTIHLGQAHFIDCPDAALHRKKREKATPTTGATKELGATLDAHTLAILTCLRSYPDEPLGVADLVRILGLDPRIVEPALALLRREGLVRPVPKNQAAGEERNAWETTPRGDRWCTP